LGQMEAKAGVIHLGKESDMAEKTVIVYSNVG
jgi:hypothetical protein